MEIFYQFLGVIGAGLIVWLMYRTIKNNANTFNRENFNQSFTVMGILALILICFIAFLIAMVR